MGLEFQVVKSKLRVEETTLRSQFLAHFAFPSVDNEEKEVALKGATKLEGMHTYVINRPFRGRFHFILELWVLYSIGVLLKVA